MRTANLSEPLGLKTTKNSIFNTLITLYLLNRKFLDFYY
jgi:hypothetical protein